MQSHLFDEGEPVTGVCAFALLRVAAAAVVADVGRLGGVGHGRGERPRGRFLVLQQGRLTAGRRGRPGCLLLGGRVGVVFGVNALDDGKLGLTAGGLSV